MTEGLHPNLGHARPGTGRDGLPHGGVPPFGHTSPLPTFVDRDLLDHGEVWAAAGTPNTNFAIAASELVRVTRGLVCDLARR